MRIVRVPVWMVIAGVLVCFFSPILSVSISAYISNKQVAEQRARSCGFYTAMLGLYDEAPPTTDRQRAAQAAYLEQYRDRQCVPPR